MAFASLLLQSFIPAPASPSWRPTRGRSGLRFPFHYIIFHLSILGRLTTKSLFIFCGHLQLLSEENVIGVIICHDIYGQQKTLTADEEAIY